MASVNVDPVPSLHLALYYPDSCLVLTTVPQGGPRIESPSGGRSGGVRRHSVSSARGPRAGGWQGGRKWARLAGLAWPAGQAARAPLCMFSLQTLMGGVVFIVQMMTLRPREARSASAGKWYVPSWNPGLPASSLIGMKRRICKAGVSYTCQVLRRY